MILKKYAFFILTKNFEYSKRKVHIIIVLVERNLTRTACEIKRSNRVIK
jgi:hypothetical protein